VGQVGRIGDIYEVSVSKPDGIADVDERSILRRLSDKYHV
jgi:hypothetical protein